MIYFILFLPLIGFLFCSFFGNFFHFKYSQFITSFFLVISSFFSWLLFYQFIGNNNYVQVHLFNWIISDNFKSTWSLHIDTLTTVMLVVITTVSACVHIYSIGYMRFENSIPRFMGYLSLFSFFMLVLVTSDNLLQMFFGWEGVGLSSYLLIGYWYHKESANKAAIKAFIVNRVGDFGFILGIIGIFFVFNSIYFDEIFSKIPNIENAKIYFLGISFSKIDLLCFLLFFGAMGKSAQLGLHTWLPDAMEGPTPVSALIHAATMVTAGVFLIVRMSPLFDYAYTTNFFIIFIGASTAIFAATIAITQNDIKRVIAYSTCSQLGYMFFAAGLGAYNAAMFHLMTHGFFKALLFLSAGSVITALHHEQDMRKMGGLFNKMPVTGILMWIGSLSIIGFPFFAGYYSKESILENAFFSNNYMSSFAYYLGIITALLTAFYSWRLLLMTFHGETKLPKEIFNKILESPLVMIIPLIILAFGSIFSGVFFYDVFIGKNLDSFWQDSIIVKSYYEQHLPFSETLIIKSSVALGILFAVILYYYKKNLSNYLVKYLKPFYLFSYNKWYIDELYDLIFVKSSFSLASFLWNRGDKKTIDRIGPNGISKIVNIISRFLSYIQSGYIYHYVFSIFLGLILILTWFVFI